MQPSLTVVVPALNEELNLEATIKNIQETVPQYFSDWEILIFNDGSSDATGKIADRLSKQESRIRVTHHESPKNLGGCYKSGIQKATKEYLIMIPGDNECGPEVMTKIFALAGTAEMIVPFTANMQVRPLGRQLLSHLFVKLVNQISQQRLRYYNGAVLHRTELLKPLAIATDGFGYQAEILVKLLRRGHSYREVGTEITYRSLGKSKAIQLTSLLKVGSFLCQLYLSSVPIPAPDFILRAFRPEGSQRS